MSVLLPALTARGERVSVWCGTSVGAINATMFASLAHLAVPAQVEQALARWRQMRKRDVIAPLTGRGGLRTLMRAVGHTLGIPGIGLASLLDPSPLQSSLDRWIDWSKPTPSTTSRSASSTVPGWPSRTRSRSSGRCAGADYAARSRTAGAGAAATSPGSAVSVARSCTVRRRRTNPSVPPSVGIHSAIA